VARLKVISIALALLIPSAAYSEETFTSPSGRHEVAFVETGHNVFSLEALKEGAGNVSHVIYQIDFIRKDFGVKVAQVLLTREDFSDRKRYINSKNTLMTLLSYGVVPIVNENDTVATDEIRFGDNDNLAALVAVLVECERLVILSDVEGLYCRDPRLDPEAPLLQCVTEVTPEIEKLAGGAGSVVGTGGMYSKVLAAKQATGHGIPVHIINGRKKGLLSGLLAGECHGTVFSASGSRLSHRKGWIAYSSRAHGTITLDEGAARAISGMGKSLLPSGIVSVEGEFEVGDAVYCSDQKGRRIAKGITNYASSDVKRIMGRRTSEVEKILGYKYSDEVIHRDNLVLV